MKVSLLVSCYQQENTIPLYFKSVLKQTRLPDELIVADDGSGPITKRIIEEFAIEAPFPVHHVWHEDLGFRLAEIRNKGILKAQYPYLIQTDGDLILHPRFIEDHLNFAKEGHFLRGYRSLITPEFTQELLGNVELPGINQLYKNSRKAKYAARMPFIGKCLTGYPDSGVLGCNMSFFVSDLMKINGYNQDLKGWGKEDDEISIRLQNAGVRLRRIMFAGIVFHLHHRENADRDAWLEKEKLCQMTCDQKLTIVTNGIKNLTYHG